MTREQWAERLPVIQAWCEGKQIELLSGDRWVDVTWDGPLFYAENLQWRIKPEPRKVWVNEYQNRIGAHLSKEDADAFANHDRIACHEIELPPLP